jgi:hypothetical protein
VHATSIPPHLCELGNKLVVERRAGSGRVESWSASLIHIDHKNFIPNFVELAHTEHICLELGDEIDARERKMFTILAVEDDRATALDVHHRPVTKPHGPTDAGIEDGEGVTSARHMIDDASVNNPTGGVDCFSFLPDLSQYTMFHKVDKVTRRDAKDFF